MEETSSPDKRLVRLKQFQTWIDFYLDSAKVTEPNIKAIPNAAKLLNDFYWRIADNHLKEIVGHSEKEPHNIHFYKIISLTELTIMVVLPLYIEGNDNEKKTLFVNATWAWSIGLSIFLNWKIDDKPIISAQALERAYTFHEKINATKDYQTDFEKEHILWLMSINTSSTLPVITNSHVWRMLFIAAKLSEN